MNSKLCILFSCLFLFFASCSEDDGDMVDPEMETEEEMNEDPQETGLLGELEISSNLGGSDDDFFNAVIQAADGGFVMAGYTKSTDGDITDKTTDDRDVWVVKTSSQGAIQWSKTYGGSETDEANSIAPTRDGGYIVSGFTRSTDGDVSANAGFNDFWALKLSNNGTLEWEKTFGYSGDDRAYNIKETRDGGYLMVGVLDVTASGGEGNINRAPNHAGGDYWALKLDPQGSISWARYYGGTFTDTPYDFIELDSGNFIILGSSDSVDTDITNNKGDYDMWVVNITPAGSIAWQKNFGGSEIDLGYSITPTSDGNFIVTGDTRSADQDVSTALGNADVWAAKISATGTIIWEKSYGGTQFESARSITPMANGFYAICASSRSNNVNLNANFGVNDAWMLIIDNEGSLLFEKNMGGSGLDFAEGIIETSDQKIVVVGNTDSSDINFTQNKGGKDAFFIKIK